MVSAALFENPKVNVLSFLTRFRSLDDLVRAPSSHARDMRPTFTLAPHFDLDKGEGEIISSVAPFP